MCRVRDDARQLIASCGYAAELEADVRAAEAGWRGDERGREHWRQVAECIPQAILDGCRQR